MNVDETGQTSVAAQPPLAGAQAAPLGFAMCIARQPRGQLNGVFKRDGEWNVAGSRKRRGGGEIPTDIVVASEKAPIDTRNRYGAFDLCDEDADQAGFPILAEKIDDKVEAKAHVGRMPKKTSQRKKRRAVEVGQQDVGELADSDVEGDPNVWRNSDNEFVSQYERGGHPPLIRRRSATWLRQMRI